MEPLRIDPDDFDLGELEDIEQYAEVPITGILSGAPTAKALTAMVWVVLRRTDPAATVDDARKIKPADCEVGKPRPTKGGKARS